MRSLLATLATLALPALVVASGREAHTQSTTPMTDERRERTNRDFIATAFDRWRDGSQSIFDLLSDDATWTIAGTSKAAGTYRSREEFLAKVIRPFGARVSRPLVPTVRGLYADGEWVVVHFDGAAMANDGMLYDNSYAWFLRVREGRIVEATAFFDTATFDDLWTRVTPE